MKVENLIWPITNEPKILAISRLGKIGLLKWEFAGQKPGPLEKFLPASLEKDEIINLIPLPEKKDISLGLVSSDGKFKRVSFTEIADISNRSTTLLKLKSNIELKSCLLCEENSYLYIISNFGRIIKIKITENNFPYMGKLAQGSNAIKLFPGENIIESINIQEKKNKDLILITNKGYFIKYNTKEIRISQKGELGTMGINFKNNKKNSDRVINCFINNNFVYIKTNKERYEKLEQDQIDNSMYKKEERLNLSLNDDEFIKTTFSMIIPEKN